MISSQKLQDIENTVKTNFKTRLQKDPEYREEEIERVKKLDCSLFPKDFEVDQKTNEQFRELAKSAQLELIPTQRISSHRKYIGPIIVLFKKLSRPSTVAIANLLSKAIAP